MEQANDSISASFQSETTEATRQQDYTLGAPREKKSLSTPGSISGETVSQESKLVHSQAKDNEMNSISATLLPCSQHRENGHRTTHRNQLNMSRRSEHFHKRRIVNAHQPQERPGRV